MNQLAKRMITLIVAGILLFAMVLTGCHADPGNLDETKKEDPDMTSYAQQENSVKNFGAVGDAETDDTNAFLAAMEASDSIYVPAGKYAIQSDITFTIPVIVEAGALIRPDIKVTVTFERHLEAGTYRIFAGDGTVMIHGNATVYPEWFGAKNNGTTDCTDAIQNAISALPENGGRVEFMPGSYLVKDTIVISQNHVTLSGVSRQTRELSPMIVSTDSKKPVLHLKGATSGNPYDGSLEDVTLEYLEFTRKEMGIEGSDTILVENTVYTTIQHCGFAHSQNGVRAVNANGLRLLTVHATTGGDIAGKEVRGVFIDGSKRGSTGILINDFIYYAYGSTNSITYGYKDEALADAIGGSTGDRRITNFECDGSCDYGIYLSSAGDFSCDIAISDFTMDGIDTCGIYLSANKAYNWQQANISNAYFRLANAKGTASAITANSFSFVHTTNCHVDNAEGTNNGIVFENTYGSTISSCSFSGGDYNHMISVKSSKQCVINGNTSNHAGSASILSSQDCIFTSNAMPNASVVKNNCKNCIFENNITK